MDKEQKKLLVKAWQLQSKILRDISDLAGMNKPLAYGCIRTAETLIDILLVDEMSKKQELPK